MIFNNLTMISFGSKQLKPIGSQSTLHFPQNTSQGSHWSLLRSLVCLLPLQFLAYLFCLVSLQVQRNHWRSDRTPRITICLWVLHAHNSFDPPPSRRSSACGCLGLQWSWTLLSIFHTMWRISPTKQQYRLLLASENNGNCFLQNKVTSRWARPVVQGWLLQQVSGMIIPIFITWATSRWWWILAHFALL